jgi:hypothetical protein
MRGIKKAVSSHGNGFLVCVSSLLIFLDFHDDLALVGAAVATHMMDNVIFTTIAAYHKVLQRERVMGAAASSTAAR